MIDATAAELTAVPTSVSVAGTALRISPTLWRDFQPICPPDGQPLIALVLVTSDEAPLPPGISAEQIAIVHDGKVWIAPAVEEHTWMRNPSRFEVIARNGPKWGPGVVVDVILELRDADGRSHLIRVPGQPIERED